MENTKLERWLQSQEASPRTWAKTGRFGSFFVLSFLALGGHCLQCFVYQDSGHTQTPRVCHIFVLSLLVPRSTLPRNAYFSWQTLNCQIVPVLPSYSLPPPPKKCPSLDEGGLGHLQDKPPEMPMFLCNSTRPFHLPGPKGGMWGGKKGLICHFAFSLVLQCLGVPKIPKCWERQHEMCHCHTPFGVPQNASKN